MSKIGIITYHYPHLKTEQLLLSLLRRKVQPEQLQVFALPFQPRKSREVLFSHRPIQTDAVSPDILCKATGISYRRCGSDREIPNSCDIYLIGGAGILSPEAVRNKRILNAHPGIIPAARGLDAFKWSIYYSLPLGVTLHFIDQQVDEGEIVSTIPTPVFITDSIATLARRHYENEIAVLSAFEEHLTDPQNHFPELEPREATRRMPLKEESAMLRSFEKYVEKYSFPYHFIRIVFVGCALFFCAL